MQFVFKHSSSCRNGQGNHSPRQTQQSKSSAESIATGGRAACTPAQTWPRRSPGRRSKRMRTSADRGASRTRWQRCSARILPADAQMCRAPHTPTPSRAQTALLTRLYNDHPLLWHPKAAFLDTGSVRQPATLQDDLMASQRHSGVAKGRRMPAAWATRTALPEAMPPPPKVPRPNTSTPATWQLRQSQLRVQIRLWPSQ